MKLIELFETHWKDLYPKQFQVFRSKYLKMIKQSPWLGNSLYVQFSNNFGDVLDKNPYQSPDHSDPVGIYGYPIKYILNYPADVWYGMNTKFLRVLEPNTGNILKINEMNESNMMTYLYKLGYKYSDIPKLFKAIKKEFGYLFKGGNNFARYFFILIQHSYDAVNNKFTLRNGIEQTKILRSFGFDAVIDSSSKDTTAIINGREPEQIVFLHRGAYKVLEVINLRDKPHDRTATVNNPEDIGLNDKLAGMIAGMMRDSVKENNGYGKYWTTKGREIYIKFNRHQSYYQNKVMGQKKHKEDKLSNSFEVSVSVKTEFSDIDQKFTHDEPLNSIVDQITSEWIDSQKHGVDPEWKPLSKKSHEKAEEEQKAAAHKEYMKKENEKKLKWIVKYNQELQELADFFKIPFQPSTDDDENLNVEGLLTYISHVLIEYDHRQKTYEINFEEIVDDYMKYIYRKKNDEEIDKEYFQTIKEILVKTVERCETVMNIRPFNLTLMLRKVKEGY